MRHIFWWPELLSGHEAEVQVKGYCSLMQCQDPIRFAPILFCSRVLAQQGFAEVHQVVSQGAPQRHAFDFVQAAHRERCQSTVSS